MRRSRSARPGRCFSAASVLLLHLCLPRLAPGDVLRDPPDKLEVEKRALSTPAAGAGLATGYQGLSAYGFYDVGEDCTPSPLWSKEVDTESYELGCREIKAIMDSEPQVVGEGRVRRVSVAEYEGRRVAVKELRQRQGVRLHRLEVVTMDALRGNPNIVQMLGVCNTTVVTEAFPMDIQYAVKKRAGDLSILDAVVMSLDAARGLQALHEASIVHYDMKPAQMLVDFGSRDSDQLRVKLNDFNVAFFMSTGPDGSPCPFRARGGLQLGPWRTPEYLAQQPMTEKVDVYRVGLVLNKFLANGGVRTAEGRPELETTAHRSYNEVRTHIHEVATVRQEFRDVVDSARVENRPVPSIGVPERNHISVVAESRDSAHPETHDGSRRRLPGWFKSTRFQPQSPRVFQPFVEDSCRLLYGHSPKP